MASIIMDSWGFASIFLATDQNLRYEQNLKQATVSVVVLVAPSNRMSDLGTLILEARKVLNAIAPGQIIEV